MAERSVTFMRIILVTMWLLMLTQPIRANLKCCQKCAITCRTIGGINFTCLHNCLSKCGGCNTSPIPGRSSYLYNIFL
ncbi:hypothetical protein DCAR_0935427 [Daucus carota subsp. sativus]|uniref:Plant thionin family protein n=1 Tax=Daucus carota subsp. sativus TaxID=79200 RepID=A0AAF0XX38_DAUCS|nr:hypothetical protein DCAR_0935427 [Daucus carota subsp. sativus]